MDFNDFLNRVASDSVNATQTPIVMCRTCDAVCFCQPFTVAEQDAPDPTATDGTVTVTTGQCDDCLNAYGPDDHCDQPEVQDEAEARVEREYRTHDKGEL